MNPQNFKNFHSKILLKFLIKTGRMKIYSIESTRYSFFHRNTHTTTTTSSCNCHSSVHTVDLPSVVVWLSVRVDPFQVIHRTATNTLNKSVKNHQNCAISAKRPPYRATKVEILVSIERRKIRVKESKCKFHRCDHAVFFCLMF